MQETYFYSYKTNKLQYNVQFYDVAYFTHADNTIKYFHIYVIVY